MCRWPQPGADAFPLFLLWFSSPLSPSKEMQGRCSDCCPRVLLACSDHTHSVAGLCERTSGTSQQFPTAAAQQRVPVGLDISTERDSTPPRSACARALPPNSPIFQALTTSAHERSVSCFIPSHLLTPLGGVLPTQVSISLHVAIAFTTW